MTSHRWTDDDRLLAALADALRSANDVPPAFLDAGLAAPGTTDLDVEFAALVRDTSVHGGAPALAVTRAEPPTARTLTFAADRMRIEIEVRGDAVRGQLVPFDAGALELQSARQHSQPVEVDEVGWFVVEPVPPGSCRFRVRRRDGTAIVTDWVVF